MSAQTVGTYEVTTIRTADIVAGENDRRSFDRAALEELAESIASDGLGQPPTVRPVVGGYQLVCGERRTRAMRDILGWQSIPCIVRDMSDGEASALMLAENTARADLDPIDEANAYRKRIDAGQSVPDVARTAGRSVATVRGRLALLELSDDSLHLVRAGQVPLGHAVMMAGLDANRQVMALQAYDGQRLDAVSFGALCDRLKMEQDQEAMFDPDSFLRVQDLVNEVTATIAENSVQAQLERLRARVAELEANPADLMGAQEIADMLSVQVRTVHMWQHRGRFPERDATVSGLPAWKRSTVEGWARETGRL